MPGQDGSARNDEWSNVTDFEERRRIQNRIAQRKYRASAKQRLSRSNADVVAERSVSIANPSAPVSPSAPISRPSESVNGDIQHGTNTSNQSLPGINALQSDSDFNFDYLPRLDLATSPETLQRNWNALVNDAITTLGTPTVPYLQSIDNALLPPIQQDWGNSETSNHILPIPRISAGTMPNSPITSGSWRLPDDPFHTNSQQHHSQLPQLSLLLSDTGDNTRNLEHTNLPTISVRKKQDVINPGYSNRSSIEGDKNTTRPPKLLSSVQGAMVKCAYEQGREEARASFKSQRSQMQRKIDGLVDSILETYRLGISLEIFRDNPNFESHVQDTKTHLRSLHRSSSQASRTSPLTLWLKENAGSDVEMGEDDE